MTGELSTFDVVSCVNANFCMLEGVGATYIFSAGSLKSLDNRFPSNSLITDLTCTSSSFCIAVGSDNSSSEGSAYSYST